MRKEKIPGLQNPSLIWGRRGRTQRGTARAVAGLEQWSSRWGSQNNSVSLTW